MSFAQPKPPPRRRHSRFGALWRGIAALPSALATLRKVMFDLTAVALPFVAVIFFLSIVTNETVIIEAPSVPQTVQDRGITPELLTQMLQARIQQVYAGTRQNRVVSTPASMQVASSMKELGSPSEKAKTLEEVIIQILSSAGAEQQPGTEMNPRTEASNCALQGSDCASDNAGAAGNSATGSASAPDEALKKQLLDSVSKTFFTGIEANGPAEMASPAQEPLVIETAGLHLSLDSLAHMARRLLGFETQRRLTMSVLCKTSTCGDEELILHVVASADRLVAAVAVDLTAATPDPAIDVAALHLLEHFDPQVLATHHYLSGSIEKARGIVLRFEPKGDQTLDWVHNLLALIAIHDNDWGLAGSYLDKVLEAGAEDLPTLVNVGLIKLNTGKESEAQGYFERALAIDERSLPALVNFGLLKLQAGKASEAQGYFERALAIDERSLPALVNLGVVELRDGNLHVAKEWLDRALRIDPDYAPAQGHLGNVLLRLCDWEGATTAYQRALKQDPKSAVALTGQDLLTMLPLVKVFHFSALTDPASDAGSASVGSVKESGGSVRQVSLAEVIELSSFCEGAAEKPLTPQLVSD